jgi:hypothetical protein
LGIPAPSVRVHAARSVRLIALPMIRHVCRTVSVPAGEDAVTVAPVAVNKCAATIKTALLRAPILLRHPIVGHPRQTVGGRRRRLAWVSATWILGVAASIMNHLTGRRERVVTAGRTNDKSRHAAARHPETMKMGCGTPILTVGASSPDEDRCVRLVLQARLRVWSGHRHEPETVAPDPAGSTQSRLSARRCPPGQRTTGTNSWTPSIPAALASMSTRTMSSSASAAPTAPGLPHEW